MSKFTDEVWTQKARHKGTVVFEDGDGATTLKVFEGVDKTLEIGAWWDGCGGEWTPEYLTVNLDRSDVTDLRDHLTKWLEETK